ncbi:MAG: hypothetical protein HYS46_04045 [Betaproteobacteria bacterium]|nr:hypothetical protein [Betaproteobacteria bacterium]
MALNKVVKVLALAVVLCMLSGFAYAQAKIPLPESPALPSTVKITVATQPDIPRGDHGLPKFSIVFGSSWFTVPKENFIVAKLFDALGKPNEGLEIEFEQSYFVDYYAARMDVIKKGTGAAALAAVSPAAAAAFGGPAINAQGIAYVLARGRANGKPFAIRTEHLYTGVDDPATTNARQYGPIAAAALSRAAQEIADAIRK